MTEHTVWYQAVLAELAARRAGVLLFVGTDGRLWCWPRTKLPESLAARCELLADNIIRVLRSRAVCSEIPLPRE